MLSLSSYDAVVIGTGFGGSVAACRLAQAGLKVGILERGRRYSKGTFPRDFDSPLAGWLWQHKQGLFDVRVGTEMAVVQSAGYGGGSLIYANVHLRMPPDAFAAGAWPSAYSRTALDPYYDLVAYMLDIKPISAEQPMGLPPRSAGLAKIAADLKRQEQFRYLNLAVNFTDPMHEAPNKFGIAQGGCNHCGECDIGCNKQAKNTLDLNYLALAERSGAEPSTLSEAFKIVRNGDGYRVWYRDHDAGGVERVVDAKTVFVCAGAVNSTELLLRCRDEHRTLPQLSPALGTQYSGNGDYLGFAFDTAVKYAPYAGPTITTGMVYDRGKGDNRDWFIFEDGGYPAQIGRLLQILNPHSALLDDAEIVGTELVEELRHLGGAVAAEVPQSISTNSAVFLAMGRDRANGRISLVAGSHALQIVWDVPSNLPLYGTEERFCKDVAKQLGGEFAPAPQWKLRHQPVSVHNLGGCVMADTVDRGVVDAQGEVFNYPNLFVLDGAALPAATGVNPSHTIAAVAERNIESAIRRLQSNAQWLAPERAKAPRRVDPLDDIVIPPDGTVPTLAPAIDVSFTETMRGYCAPGAVDYEACYARGKAEDRHMQFVLDITLPDVDRFLADKMHAGIARGRVVVDGLTPPGGAEVGTGVFNLFVAGDGPGRRKMLYALPFYGHDGKPYLLDGFKDVRDDGTFDVWKATSTLYTVVREGHNRDGAVVMSGIIIIEKLDFLKQMTTLRATGGSPAAEADALLRFGGMFAGTLWDTFVRAA
jgi:cholesterol oxidase